MDFTGGAAFENPDNWHSRGYLPHYDASSKYQMLTYRLADSLPANFSLPGSAGGSPAEKLERRKLIEQVLDNGYGSCVLKIPEVATLVEDNFKYFDKKKYDLIAYVVMPNHVHLLIKTYDGFPLSEIIHSWKSFTSRQILKTLENMNEFSSVFKDKKVWQKEYWDRFIRSHEHYLKAIEYIHQNPVKAGLVSNAKDWIWSSAKVL